MENNQLSKQRPSLVPFVQQRVEELNALKELASFYVQGGTVPNSFYPSSKSGMTDEQRKEIAVNKLAIAFQFGISAGLTEGDVIQGVYVVNNVPQVWGKTMAKMIRMHSACKELWVDVEYEEDGTPTKATWTLVRHDSSRELKVSFSKQQAIEANLWGKWQANQAGSYTEDMLIWKALKRMRDRYIPEAASGFDLREDMQEVNELKEKEQGNSRQKASPSPSDIQAVLAQIEESYTLRPKESKESLEQVSAWISKGNFPEVVSANLAQAWFDVGERMAAEASVEEAEVVDTPKQEEHSLDQEEEEKLNKLLRLKEKGKYPGIIDQLEEEKPLETMSPNEARKAIIDFKELYEAWENQK